VRIGLRISGGFAGAVRPPIVVDTTARDDGPELEALARRVAEQHSDTQAQPQRGADRFQYDLQLGDRHLRLHDGALTPEAERLITRLKRAHR
jgi:hypothetical protein